jgi:starch-binding outer membrane protein, SusD/RagB family
MTTISFSIQSRRVTGLLLLPSIIVLLSLYSCEVDLDEFPLAEVSDAAVLSSKDGFDVYTIGLNQRAREMWLMDDNTYRHMFNGSDMYNTQALEGGGLQRNWVSFLTPATGFVGNYWAWAYTQMIPQANNIISYGMDPERQGIWASEDERNAALAEAHFFRGWTYRFLADMWGGVPIVERVEATPRYDYVRATRQEVYEFAKNDLEFASRWLPEEVAPNWEGRIVRAAADHVLAEVYISLGQYENAIASASRVIDSDLYELMTGRFGVAADQPGDVFSDLFQKGNYNRSSGNTESIYVWQVQDFTPGGGGSRGGNPDPRWFAPFLVNITDPDGFSMVVTDSLNRGVGGIRGSNYSLYQIWRSDWDNDIRNSRFNMRREFYYNNPASPYYLTLWVPEHTRIAEDTLRRLYAYSRKVEGPALQGNPFSGQTNKPRYAIRLAETYLVRAEAYLKNNDPVNAALDINALRERANATPVTPGEVTIEYILDERARELKAEEPRVITLRRMGKYVERVRLYDPSPGSRASVQDYHELWPIPQRAIDANIGVVLEQNPGY